MENTPLIAPRLLAIMQCPACTGVLSERRDRPALVCGTCGRAYRVDNGIPNMIVDEAEPPSDD